MGNLYRLNSLFEMEIAQFPNPLHFEKSFLERSTAFEYLFLIISQSDDFTILSETPSEELLEHWQSQNISYGKIICVDTPYYANSLSIPMNKDGNHNLIEWGETSVYENKLSEIIKNESIIAKSLSSNSKINQTIWKEKQGLNKLSSKICSNKDELLQSVSQFNFPFVIKSEFSFSGRGNLIINTKDSFDNFINNSENFFQLNRNGFIIEEWVNVQKTLDFSGIFEYSESKFKRLATTKMLVDNKGTYRGSLIERNFGMEFKSNLEEIVNSFRDSNPSYQGALSIDGFTFKKDNALQTQFMSEINCRYSMGRILFEMHKKFGNVKNGCALFFLPIKNKNLSFKSLLSNLTVIGSKFESKIIIITPLNNKSNKQNSFLGFYIDVRENFLLEIIESIKLSLV